MTVCAAYHIVPAFFCFPAFWATYLFSVLLGVVVESVIFWDGMLCVYLSSTQLGIKLRVLGVVFGFVPIANIVFLIRIIRTVRAEVAFETEKFELNEKRKALRVCATKYPVLFVHGVFFRDTRFFNYWGRIPAELIINAATKYSLSVKADFVSYTAFQTLHSVQESGGFPPRSRIPPRSWRSASKKSQPIWAVKR